MSDYDGIEVPWGPEPVLAALAWQPGELLGDLAFVDPKTGRIVDIAVTRGPPYSTEREHVWHIEFTPGRPGAAVVSPSVHFIGHFHSGNPATFRLV